MRKLEGKRIALTGPRRSDDLSRMVERLGGIALLRPAQGTVFLEDAHVEAELRVLVDEEIDWFIVTTGIGFETLQQIANKLGIEEAFLAKLKQAKVAVRGYKAFGVLKKLGVEPLVRDDDGTTAGLVRALSAFNLKGCRVALQLHGDPAPRLVRLLEEQEATFREILPYRHVPPEPEILAGLITEIVNGEIDAVTFTSGPQVRFMLNYARSNGLMPSLLEAFAGPVVAVSVGKFTAELLREEGVARVIVPEEERMGGMVMALAEYYEVIDQHQHPI